MYYNNNFPDSFFARGHRTLTLGTIILGGLLFLLAIMIFAYPALIAYFIAAVILFAGLSVLAIGWKLWRFRNEITKLDKIEDDSFHYKSPRTSKTHFTYFRW
ncbi:MAG: hypothetical protein JKY23_01120 [Nitrospinaceae bacterium]|nr:hypothetical protein [Nitrospinaceae bacterium]